VIGKDRSFKLGKNNDGLIIREKGSKKATVSTPAMTGSLDCTAMPGKPSGVYKMLETAWAAGALPGLAAPSPRTQPPLLAF